MLVAYGLALGITIPFAVSRRPLVGEVNTSTHLSLSSNSEMCTDDGIPIRAWKVSIANEHVFTKPEFR